MQSSSPDAIRPDSRAQGAMLAFARFTGARAAVFVVAALMAHYVADGMTAFLEYALFRASSDALPSWPTRVAIGAVGDALGLGVLLVAIRRAASVPTHRARPSGLVWLGLFVLGVLGASGVAASLWFPMQVAEAIGRARPVSDLATWAEDSLRVSLFGIATKTLITLLALVAAAMQWSGTVEAWATDPPAPTNADDSGSNQA